MRLKSALFISIFILSMTASSLEAKADDAQRKKWEDSINDYKKDFLIRELGLNAKQEEEFIPMYFEMQEDIFSVGKEEMQIEKNIRVRKSVSDKEYKSATQRILKQREKAVKIKSEYFERFSQILTPKQVFQLLCAEKKFQRDMLRHRKPRDRR